MPTFTDNYLAGTTTNNSWLRSAAPYGANLQIPILPQLEGGLATSGFAIPGFWNESMYTAAHTGAEILELVELRGASSPYLNFDQIFVVNNGTEVINDVMLLVEGYTPYLLGTLDPGAVWTTTFPAGLSVLVYACIRHTGRNRNPYLCGRGLHPDRAYRGRHGTVTWRWIRNGATVQDGLSDTMPLPMRR